MPISLALKAFIIWMGILVLAMVNGLLRESLLTPALGGMPALILSGLLLSFLIIVVAYLTLPWLQATGLANPLRVGSFWLVLTLLFEFTFGRWQGKSWSELLEAYTFQGGNIWPLVLLVTALAPWIAAKIRGTWSPIRT